MLKILITILFSISCFSNPLDEAQISLKDTIVEEHENDSLKFLFTGSYVSLNNDAIGTNITGFGANFQAMYILSDKFAIGGGAGTLVSEPGGSGAATILNWAFTYALTGNLKSSLSKYSLNGKEVVNGANSISEGLRAQGFLSQYYFNGTKNTIPYSGIGGQIYYDKYIERLGTNVIFGLRVDQLFNNEVSLLPITFSLGILI